MAKSMSVLIVDDDEGDRKQIRRALKQSGLPCECTETETVKDALEACEKLAFDCAFVDYQIPGQDGLSGVSALSARLPFMAIVMSTGQGDEMVATEAMKRGASDYILKSLITPQSIFRTVKNAIEKTALRKELEQQRRELENFARVLVHDFKSPVSSVRGFAKLIEETIREGNAEKVIEYCRIVVKGVDRMGALIDALHRYAVAEKPVPLEKVGMGQVMSDTLKNLEHLLQESGALVTYDELPEVNGHGPLLIQLLQNLVSNGIKYCKADIPSIHVVAAREGDGWLFTVQDNGIGIPEKQCQEVFEPFKRLHSAGEYEGTGLGLATCKKIVERHDGRIWCDSRGGEGTAFHFTLPGSRNGSY
jgi:signal transduction histidine kinase